VNHTFLGARVVRSSDVGSAIHLLLVAVASYAGTLLAGQLRYPGIDALTVFPAYAILTTALLFSPMRRWWVLVIAATSGNLLAFLSWGWPFASILFADFGNVVRSLTAALLLKRGSEQIPDFDSLRGTLNFLLSAVVIGPALGALAGAAGVLVDESSWSFGHAWYAWFAANGLTALTMLPLLLIALRLPLARPHWTPWRTAEAILLGIGLLLVSVLLFQADFFVAGRLYLLLPCLLWAAVRFGPIGINLAILTISALAVTGAVAGRGPFINQLPDGNLQSLYFFLIFAAVPPMLLAAVLQERERATQALLASERSRRETDEQVRVAAAGAGLGFWTHDLRNEQLWVSERCREILGLGPQGRLTRHMLQQAIHPDDRANAVAQYVHAIAREQNFQAEYRVVRRDGSVHWVSNRAQIVRDRVGSALRVSGILQDITDRREADQVAQEQRRELVHLSRVAMQGELSGGFAHELSQPVAAILNNGFAMMHYLDADPPELTETRNALQNVVADARRAAAIIRQLRAYLVKGKTSLFPADLNTVATEALRLVGNDLAERKVTVTTTYAEALPPVLCDRVQLEQVVVNLILNACEAMEGAAPEDAEIKLITRLESELHPGDAIRLSVIDRGSGIPEENIDDLFKPFVTSKPHGLGLGLSICRAIVSAHGGQLWGMNNPDEGAAFHITLPAYWAGQGNNVQSAPAADRGRVFTHRVTRGMG
jgi:PAS domain S-box-containing protein